MSEARTACPICGADMPLNPRYPRAVCPDCMGRAASIDGRRLRFGNVSLSGGYAVFYTDTGELYPLGHLCWIDGIQCHADEAHMGGIAVEVV